MIILIHKGRGKSTKDTLNPRSVALVSYLCELTERLVLNRLVYTIKSK